MKTLSGTDGVLAGLIRDQATPSAVRQMQVALGATSVMLSIDAICLPTLDTSITTDGRIAKPVFRDFGKNPYARHNSKNGKDRSKFAR